MKKALDRIVKKIHDFFASDDQPFKKIVMQINQYLNEQIDELFENMKTGKPREDRKTRERVKVCTGVIFILCGAIIIAFPLTYIISVFTGKLTELSVKSPNEIIMDLDDRVENYPEVEMIPGIYTPDTAAENVGAYWQAGGYGTNLIILSDGEYVLTNAIEERVSTANFLQLQYDSGVRDVIKVYTQDMKLFCMMNDPVLYQENSYIAANPYITLHAMDGFTQWEIFSFYECRFDEMDMLSKQMSANELSNYLMMKSIYQSQEVQTTEARAEAQNLDVEYDGNILVIMATDESDGTSYIIGARMAV